MLGLDFGGTKIATAVCDLAGNKLASAVVDSQGELGARASFDRGILAARELLAQTADGATLAAVGVATFGIPFEDRVDLAPAISGWSTLPIGRELRRAFPGARVTMATDAKAAAQRGGPLGRAGWIRPGDLPESGHWPRDRDRGRRHGPQRQPRRFWRDRLQPAQSRRRHRPGRAAGDARGYGQRPGARQARGGRGPHAQRGRGLRRRARPTRHCARWSTTSSTSLPFTW